MERIVFFLGDGAFITLYYIFNFQSSYITQYDLDFFGLAGIIAIDLLLFMFRGGRLMCYGADEGRVEVNPEQPTLGGPTPVVEKKINKYEHDSGE